MLKKVLAIFLFAVILSFSVFGNFNAGAVNTSSKAGIVITKNDPLTVRAKPSVNSTALSYLAKNSYITLISKSGEWWYVEYAKNKFGYCFGGYIKETTSTVKTVKVTSGRLNVRSGAGTNYGIIGGLSANEVVLVLSSKNGWSKILYNGRQVGYASDKYLSLPSDITGKRLNVPSYKQNDSRWANVKVGSSGKTISQIGCTTTAIAMMESYRQGKTITPDIMVKNLKYTSTGNVYWPSDYIVTTDKTDYLGKFRTLINQNKPILAGFKNTNGSQHWVVVVGYSGSGTVPTDFIINDPGSNSRTKFSEFINAYPNFYKFFHY